MKKLALFYFSIIAFCILVSLPVILPYFNQGYFPTHDGEWAVVRLADMFREIKDLQIPPRFSGNLNFNYGYPLFNFAYPFPYYVGLGIYMLGFGFVESIKIIFALSVPLSAFFMFFASKNIWKSNTAGIISAALYIYFPYRLVDLFVRGSIGESVAFVLFPIILLCLSKIADDPKTKKYILIGGIASSFLVLAHNIMAVLFMITVLIFFIGNIFAYKKKIYFQYIYVFLIGLVLSAFFWLPALVEKKYILLSIVPIADRSVNFVSLNQFLFSKWGYGVPTDVNNGFTYQIGWPFLIVIFTVIIYLAYLLFKKIKFDTYAKLATSLVLGLLFFSMLLFSFSAPVWKLPLLKEINFPWTVLSQLGLISAILAGFLSKNNYTKYLSIGIIVLALILYVPLAKPSEYFDKGDGYYFTNTATTTSSSELMPLWVKEKPLESPNEKVKIIKGKGAVGAYSGNSHKFSFEINLEEPSIVRINSIYFPGWLIRSAGKEIEIDYSNNQGLMEIYLEKGKHNVVGEFKNTQIRSIANSISFAGALFILLYSLILAIKFYKNK